MAAHALDWLHTLIDWYFYGPLLARTASPAETTWTLAALLGVLLNLASVYDAQADLFFLRRNRINGARELVARGHRRNANVRGAVKTVFLAFGIAAMNNPPSAVHGNPATYIAGTCFLGAILALTYLDLVDRRERRKLIGLLTHRRTAIDPLIDGVVSVDVDSRVVTWSVGAERIFGYTGERIVGETLEMLMLPEYWALHQRGMARFLTTGESRVLGRPYNTIGLNSDGKPLPVEVTISELAGDGAARFTAVVRQRGTMDGERRDEGPR